MYTVYILECSDQSLYTGYTVDLAKRLKAHNSGKTGAKYTRVRRPVRVVYTQKFRSLSKALKREAEIKRLRRSEKIRLIEKLEAA